MNDSRIALMLAPYALPGSKAKVVMVDGDPIPKERPRFNRKTGKVYTPDSTSGAEDAIAWTVRHAHVPFFSDEVAVAIIFFRGTRRRVDVDNLVKLVLDGATKAGIWEDDSQVTALHVALELDPERPRTVIGFAPRQAEPAAA